MIKGLACSLMTLTAMLNLPVYSVAGPINELYLTTGSQVFVIQGNNIVRSWNTVNPFQEIPLAVEQTVRTLGFMPGGQGAEYSLGGTPTGPIYTNTVPLSFVQLTDGTTDGKFNYAVDFEGTGVWRFNRDWSDPHLLFSNRIPFTQFVGITFDPVWRLAPV
jgi:hypothetical protein